MSGGGDSGGKRAICDRVQLLTLAKACNHFLMCAVLLVSLSKLITFSKEGGGGHSNSFGGARPTNAPPWRRPCLHHPVGKALRGDRLTLIMSGP